MISMHTHIASSWHSKDQYSDAIMSAMASQITNLTIVYSTEVKDIFVSTQGQVKENTKPPRHWP